jgi:hypothetical protein
MGFIKARSFLILLAFSLSIPAVLRINAQSNRHWVRSFNEESSLLSGAVVGGGVGPSAIYYNPAGIDDVENSSLSLHASLFSIEFYNLKNILGGNLDLNSTRIQIQPRFISYLIHPRKNRNFSIELAYLNNELFKVGFTKSVDENVNVLKSLPGEERYFAIFNYTQDYRDDWIGVGTSWRLNNSLFLGASMFVQIKTSEYQYYLDIEAFPLQDTVSSSSGNIPFYSANYQKIENYHFNNYRLIWKLGILYKWERVSLGITLRTPSVKVFSDGKRVSHKEKQANITNPLTGEFLPDYVIVDSKEKKDVTADLKDPFSVAAGMTISLPGGKRTIFTTVEYFHGLANYQAITAETNVPSNPVTDFNPATIENWLTFDYAARPVLNAAIGFRSQIKENLRVFAGFRTDFNYRKGVMDDDDIDYQYPRNLDLDVYHLTGGLNVRVFGQDLIAGFQYSIGRKTGIRQVANLATPLEYNPVDRLPLQGIREENATILYNSISLYFGATLNFKKDKDQP